MKRLKDMSADGIVMSVFIIWLIFLVSWVAYDKFGPDDIAPPNVTIEGQVFPGDKVLVAGATILRDAMEAYTTEPSRELLTGIWQMGVQYAGYVDAICYPANAPEEECAMAMVLLDDVAEFVVMWEMK